MIGQHSSHRIRCAPFVGQRNVVMVKNSENFHITPNLIMEEWVQLRPSPSVNVLSSEWYRAAFPVVTSGDGDSTIKIAVKFMSIARQRAGAGVVEFASRESKLRDVLKAIVASYRITDIILTEKGEVRPWARVLVNGRSQELIGGLDIELHNGDSVALIYPYAENF